MNQRRKSPAGNGADSQHKTSASPTPVLYRDFLANSRAAVHHREMKEPSPAKAEMNPIKRLYAKPTRKNAINAFCAYCMGCTASEQGNGRTDHLERGFRTSISKCTAPACPLFNFRPYQVKTT